MYLLLLISCFVFQIKCDSCSRTEQQTPQLLVIGFDGFRWDYIREFNTPTFWNIAANGVHAPFGLIPAFTTKTFPNFWTIVTGLYEESHGIIDNSFYDPNYNESFSIFNKASVADEKWWKGEPIWSTAKKHGKTAGVFFWPGSEVRNKLRPDFWRRYNSRVGLEERIETVLNWIEVEKVDLAMMYYNQPDHTSHKYGTFHRRVQQMVEYLDQVLNYLITQLMSRQLLHKVNILIVSDHGMTDLNVNDKNAIIYLSDYIDIKNDVIDVPQSAAIAAILPKPDKIEKVYQSLKDANAHMKVYLKDEIPERYHYKHNDRIMPIIAVADEGYFIFRRRYKLTNIKIGQHGFDNSLMSMRPIFFAMGPDFKTNYDSEPFETVNLYSLMCYLLDMQPAENNVLRGMEVVNALKYIPNRNCKQYKLATTEEYSRYSKNAKQVVEDISKLQKTYEQLFWQQRKVIASLMQWATSTEHNEPLKSLAVSLSLRKDELRYGLKDVLQEVETAKNGFESMVGFFEDMPELEKEFLVAAKTRRKVKNTLRQNGYFNYIKGNDSLLQLKADEKLKKNQFVDYLLEHELGMLVKARSALSSFTNSQILFGRAMVATFADINLDVQYSIPRDIPVYSNDKFEQFLRLTKH